MADVDLTRRAPSLPIPFARRERLDNEDYRFEFQWSSRANEGQGAWFMTIINDIGVALIRNRKLVVDTDILSKYKYIKGVPQGELDVVSSNGANVPIGIEDLNQSVSVIYREVQLS